MYSYKLQSQKCSEQKFKLTRQWNGTLSGAINCFNYKSCLLKYFLQFCTHTFFFFFGKKTWYELVQHKEILS